MILDFIPEQEYRAMEGLTKTDLSYLAKSPLHYINRSTLFKETDAMKLGTLVHKAILEPMEFKNKFVLAPKEIDGQPVNRRVKAHREFLQDFEASLAIKGQTSIDESEMDTLSGILAQVGQDKTLPDLINRGFPEATAVWEIDGRKCKGRSDYFLPNSPYGRAVIEIKTTNDGRLSSFSRQSYNLNYDLGAWWYLNGFEATEFIFVVLETKPPYPISIFRADESFLAHGEMRAKKLLEQLKKCEDSGIWHGYTSGMEMLTLPSWSTAIELEETY